MSTPEPKQTAPSPLWSADKQARYMHITIRCAYDRATADERDEFAQLTTLREVLTKADALVSAIHASAAAQMTPDERQALLDELTNVLTAIHCAQSVVWDAHHHSEAKA